MKLRELLEFVSSVKPNAFTMEALTAFVNEVEGSVQRDVFLLAEPRVVQYRWETVWEGTVNAVPDGATMELSAPSAFQAGDIITVTGLETYDGDNGTYTLERVSDSGKVLHFTAGTLPETGEEPDQGQAVIRASDRDRELLVAPPHDKLYRHYVCAMVDYYNGEYSKYANTMDAFNGAMHEFERWFSRVFAPAQRECQWKGYYLSAYAIAVKHGFAGTEEEWLESLVGAQGDPMEILGHYETLAELEAEVTNPRQGDGYAVGSGEPYRYYLYDKKRGWVDHGTLSPVAAESWARGGTGTRPGEDTDNAMYYAGQAAQCRDGAAASQGAAAGSAAAAESARSAAQTAKAGAEAARTGAEAAQGAAESAEDGAQAAQTGAESARSAAQTAQAGAEAAMDDAQGSAESAAASASAAENDRSAAQAAQAGAQAAKGAAEAARDAAQESAESAAGSASQAENAKSAAQAAQTGAQDAQGAAEEARDAAQTAQLGAAGSAGSAAESASQAESAKSAAQSAQTGAQTARGAAEAARDAAQTAQDGAEEARDAAQAAQAGAEAAQEAAEAARDQAQEIVGGDFATRGEAQGYVGAHNQSADAHQDIRQDLNSHIEDKDNPHEVDPEQIGAIPATQKGVAGGVATLGSDGKVPTGQLPAMNYDPAGSAAAVQQALSAHIADKGNPHGVDAEQAGALPIKGGTMTGFILLHANPTQEMHPATMGYVNNKVDTIVAEIEAALALV